jgi:hypothetical protein
MPINVIKVVLPSVLTFFLGVCITPFFTNFFYKYKMWKKNPRTEAGDITSSDFTKLHNTQSELSTPHGVGITIRSGCKCRGLTLCSSISSTRTTEDSFFWDFLPYLAPVQQESR